MTDRSIRLGALAAGPLLLLAAIGVTGQATELIPFEIRDQFDRLHRHSDFADKILILIGTDHEGSAFHDAWESAIRGSLEEESNPDGVAYLSVADLRGVPFFLRGMVKGKFSRAEDDWILLDWKGDLAKTYGFQSKSANVLVFAPDGTLTEQVFAREVEAEALALVETAVSGLLREAVARESRDSRGSG